MLFFLLFFFPAIVWCVVCGSRLMESSSRRGVIVRPRYMIRRRVRKHGQFGILRFEWCFAC